MAYSYEFSDMLRMSVQPRVRFRQFCDAKDASQAGLHAGDKFYWERYGDIDDTDDTYLAENEPIPEGEFSYGQGSLTIREYGKSVPYSGKFDDLSRTPVTEIINKQLKNHCAKVLDKQAHAQFDATLLVAGPASGTSATAIELGTAGSALSVNNLAMTDVHVKLIADTMKERNIPTYDGANYCAVGRPSSFRAFKDSIEAKHSYVSEGFQMMLNGEIGRHFDGIRFFEQTNIASEGWSNAKSDAVYFFGEDTVAEALVIPEEIRGRLATDYGRSKGIAWYMMGGYGIVHDTAAETRIIKWGSVS
jgi:N4-gp56 family major capsid protein